MPKQSTNSKSRRYFNSSSASNSHGTPPASSSTSSSRSELNRIFDQFRGTPPHTPSLTRTKHITDRPFFSSAEAGDPPDTIGVTGSMSFLQTIDVGLEEPTVLVIAELLKAPTMGEFSRDGFSAGWTSIGCKTLDQMRAKVPGLRASLQSDEATFKRVYMYTYSLARTPGQKSLPQEAAAEYWKLLLGKRFEAQLPMWIEFLEKEYKKSITKDTWNCMYDFVQLAQKDPSLDTYDVDGAWPSILDDFVRYWRKSRAS